jgi:FkbM family methyltransferase
MVQVRVPFAVQERAWSLLMDDHDAKDHIVNIIAQYGLQSYERPTPDLVAGFALSFGGNFLDIGANTGVYSLLYSRLAAAAMVYAFEPLANIANALEANVRLNPDLADRIHIERYALSDRAGSFTWYETVNDQGLFSTSSTLLKSRAKSIGNYRTTTIKTRTLDEFALERDLKFGLAKLDVEGHEPAVLAGASRTIGANRPVLIVEVLREATCEALNSWAEAMGYAIYAPCAAASANILLRLDRLQYVAGAPNQVLCPTEHVDRLIAVAKSVGLVLG